MKITLRSLLALFLLISPALSYGQGPPPPPNMVGLVPDGRTENDSIPVNNSAVYVFATLPGHSYSIEQSRGLNQPTLPMYIFPGCPGPFGPAARDTSSMDPAVDINNGLGPQRQREAFACPGPVYPSLSPGMANIMIFNSGTSPYSFSITVADTTLHSAKWSAGTNSDTFWTFTNTSSGPVNISMNVVDSNGFAQMFPGLPNPGPMSIAPGATVSVDTTQIPSQFRNNPPLGGLLNGSVRVAQDGPPGAILATAAIVTNASGPIPTTESVKFETKPR